MEAIIKFLVVLVLLEFGESHFLTKEEVVTRVCHGDSGCIKGASQCLEAIKPTSQELKKISSAFDSCVTSLNMETTLANFYGSGYSDLGVANGQKTLYMYLPFIEFVEKQDATAASKFRCCFGRATNSLDKEMNVNKTYFKSKITQKATKNKDALQALLTAVDACSPQTFNCDGHEFRVCFIERCSKNIRN